MDIIYVSKNSEFNKLCTSKCKTVNQILQVLNIRMIIHSNNMLLSKQASKQALFFRNLFNPGNKMTDIMNSVKLKSHLHHIVHMQKNEKDIYIDQNDKGLMAK